MAREGLPFIFILFLINLIIFLLFLKTLNLAVFTCMTLCFLMLLFTLFFFRDPERDIPVGQNQIVAPADGKIIDISEVDDDYAGGRVIKVSIFLSVFNVHINRIPATGKIERVKYFKGKFLAAWNRKASLDNEQTHIGINCGSYKLLVKQIAGLIARRIVYRVQEGDQVKRGDRFGMIKFGSRTDLHLPLKSRLFVGKGDKVYGGSTVIAVVE